MYPGISRGDYSGAAIVVEAAYDNRELNERHRASWADVIRTLAGCTFEERESVLAELEGKPDVLRETEEALLKEEVELVCGSLETDDRTATSIVLVAVPEDISPANKVKIQSMAQKMNRSFARRGFGYRGKLCDIRQVRIFEYDKKDTSSMKREIKRAVSDIREIREKDEEAGNRARITLFAPEGPLVGAANDYIERDYQEENITVLRDSYNDKHPDLFARVALGRQITYYYNAPGDRDNTINRINSLLSRICEDYTVISSIEDLLKSVLRIRLIKEFLRWREYHAAAISF